MFMCMPTPRTTGSHITLLLIFQRLDPTSITTPGSYLPYQMLICLFPLPDRGLIFPIIPVCIANSLTFLQSQVLMLGYNLILTFIGSAVLDINCSVGCSAVACALEEHF